MNHKFLECLLLIFYIRHAKSTALISETIILHQTFSTTRFLLTGSLSFIAAAVSSAAGLGGGSLFIPILTIFAGLDVKTASSYSAFMVTGGSIANVANNLLSRNGAKRLIDYDIALLCQPWMLLGVSCGVILNRVFPEWLIMVIFVVLVAFCTFKTCKSGVLHWKMESRGLGRDVKMENEDCCGSTQEPLLGDDCDIVDQGSLETPWMKIGMLVVIWVCFFVLYLLRGNHYGQGIIKIEACGIGYWIISSMQIPLAIIFTSWILFRAKNNASTQQENRELTRSQPADRLIFPIMALLAGTLGGIFGIGGGMIISPILLQLGIKPEVAPLNTWLPRGRKAANGGERKVKIGERQIVANTGKLRAIVARRNFGLTWLQPSTRGLGPDEQPNFPLLVQAAPFPHSGWSIHNICRNSTTISYSKADAVEKIHSPIGISDSNSAAPNTPDSCQ
ncbi:hypothetical protein ACS0TY_031154 [Phlomoides rotata]